MNAAKDCTLQEKLLRCAMALIHVVAKPPYGILPPMDTSTVLGAA